MTTRTYLLISSLILLFFSGIAHAAKLTSHVDRYRIGMHETLTLTISYNDSNILGKPDLNGLKKNFEILNTSDFIKSAIGLISTPPSPYFV